MKKIIISGLLGFLLTLLGFSVGLQISPLLGSILLFPFVIVGYFSQVGFGNFPIGLKLLLFVLTIAFWTWVGLLIYKIKP